MTDKSAPASKTPWHLWVVGIVSLLWNAVGAMDFVMTQMRNEAYLKAFTPEQLEYFHSFPLWAVTCWGVATWGSLLGSALLLARRGLAYQVFVGSTVCMVLTTLYSFGLSDGLKVMGGGAGMIIFNALIFIIGILLLVYAKSMRQRGVLR